MLILVNKEFKCVIPCNRQRLYEFMRKAKNTTQHEHIAESEEVEWWRRYDRYRFHKL